MVVIQHQIIVIDGQGEERLADAWDTQAQAEEHIPNHLPSDLMGIRTVFIRKVWTNKPKRH
jgi:hypothetical protein